jgi:hypothetical protein
MSDRAARRRREREEKKAKKQLDGLLRQMSQVHIAIARSEHPKRAALLQLSRDMIAMYHGLEEQDV